METLNAKIEKMVAEQKAEAQKQMKKLEENMKKAQARLKEVSNSAEGAWEETAKKFDTLAEDMAASVKKFWSAK